MNEENRESLPLLTTCEGGGASSLSLKGLFILDEEKGGKVSPSTWPSKKSADQENPGAYLRFARRKERSGGLLF